MRMEISIFSASKEWQRKKKNREKKTKKMLKQTTFVFIHIKMS